MKKSLVNPKFGKYRQGDTLQYLKDILGNLDHTSAGNLNLSDERMALETVVTELNNRWQPERKSLLTAELAAIDEERDRVFSGFKMTMDNWSTNHYDPDVRYAALVISENIATHGERITSLRYQLETATIRAVVNDCETVHAGFVGETGLSEWVSQIRTLNESFETKYNERSEELGQVEKGVIAGLIEEAIDKYTTLAGMFESRMNVAAADADPSLGLFQNIMQTWDSITTQYNDAVLRYSNPEEGTD